MKWNEIYGDKYRLYARKQCKEEAIHFVAICNLPHAVGFVSRVWSDWSSAIDHVFVDDSSFSVFPTVNAVSENVAKSYSWWLYCSNTFKAQN